MDRGRQPKKRMIDVNDLNALFTLGLRANAKRETIGARAKLLETATTLHMFKYSSKLPCTWPDVVHAPPPYQRQRTKE